MKMLSVLAEPFTRYQGEIYLTDRTLQSLAETTKHMELLVTSSQGVQEYDSPTLPRNLDKVSDYLPSNSTYLELPTSGLIEKLSPDIISTLGTPSVKPIEAQNIPVCYSIEFTSKTRLNAYYSQPNISLINKARIYVGEKRQNKKFKQLIHNASGIEINGDGAYEEYGSINPRTIRYYDHRIYQHDLDSVQISMQPKNGAGITVAFSGRWTAVKGTDLFLEIAAQTHALNPDIQFVIMGDGEYRDLVQEYQYPNLQNLGFIKFDPEWKKYVRDYNTLEWIELQNATVVKADIKTPMNYGYAFFAKKEDADKFVSEQPGAMIVSWEAVDKVAHERYMKKKQMMQNKEDGQGHGHNDNMQQDSHQNGHSHK